MHQSKELDLNSSVIEVNLDKGIARHDFAIFHQEDYRICHSINIRVDDARVSVSSVDLAKLVFLHLLQEQKPSYTFIKSAFNGVCTLFALIKSKGPQFSLNESDYREYFGLLFSFRPTPDGLVKRITPPSYQGAGVNFCLYKLIKILLFLDAPFELANLSKTSNNNILVETCLEVMGITFQDYRRGGSFNFLGLDIGKHYVDHCANVFEEHFQIAFALRKTFSRVEEVCDGKLLPINEKMKATFVGQILVGNGLTSALQAAGFKNLENNERIFKDSFNALLEDFRQQYEECSSLSAINNLNLVKRIIEDASLPDRFDTMEFVRSMLMAEYISDWKKSSTQIFLEYFSALSSDDQPTNKNVFYKLSHESFLGICSQAIEEHSIHLPKDPKKISKFLQSQFHKARFTNSLSGVDALRRMCFSVESAACTIFVALTGWRRSEYGFPLASLSGMINTEVLDNLYTPWRFNVNWTVPKTHGTLRIDREITSYTYQIAYMASLLNLAGSDKPALYFPDFRFVSKSTFEFLSSRVVNLWFDFIENYSLFKKVPIDECDELAAIKEQLRGGLPAYEFSGLNYKTSVIQKYREGALDEPTTALLDARLSATTKEFIRDDSNEISRDTVLAVRKDVMADLPYPTAHAFRHIWAEAVLTRYRGDVGKVIQANFKHMDGRFFMAYLRGKETLAIYRIAERTVINNIVRQHVLSANEQHQNYAGGFQRFVSKTARMTKVIKPEEQAKLIEKISDRVIGMMANPWATCMLRSASQHRAKCAEEGIPQRRNADPKFCLGCIHSDISEMNYQGIVISIKDDVSVCRNIELPLFIKSEHAITVKNGLSRVKELKRNSGTTKYDKYINHLEESLEMASMEPLKWVKHQ